MNEDPRTKDRRSRVRDPANDPKLCGHTGHRNKAGKLCSAMAIEGTNACVRHAGIKKKLHKARGAIVTELRNWGLTDHDELANPSEIMLRLLTQSAARVELYSRMLKEAYEAAERLHAAQSAPEHDALAAESARLDLERVLNRGGVAALVGWTYAADKQAGIFATGEALTGLQRLEAEERDRCMNFAAKAKQAEVGDHLIRASEQMALMVATAVEHVLARRGLDASSAEVRAEVAEELMALSGGPATIEGRLA